MNPQATVLLSLCSCPYLMSNTGVNNAQGRSAAVGALIQEQIETQEYEDALRTARAFHSRMVEQHDSRDASIGIALTYLARVQRAIGDYSASQANLARAIKLIESAEGPHTPMLHEPLTLLASVMKEAGECRSAVPVFRRALEVSRRNFGVLDDSQDQDLMELSACMEELGLLDEVTQLKQFILEVARARYGTEDIRLVSPINELADWLARTGDYMGARKLYRRSMTVVEATEGKNSDKLLVALLGIVDTHTREQAPEPELTPPSDGPEFSLNFRGSAFAQFDGARSTTTVSVMRTLRSEAWASANRALQIVENNRTVSDVLARTVYLQAGDWYMFEGDSNRALEIYDRAWERADVTGANARENDRSLQFPTLVRRVRPPSAGSNLDKSADEVEQRYVLVEFTVTARGHVEDARVVESNAGTRLEVETLRALRRCRFRPRFVDGEPQDTPDVRLRQVFRVLRPLNGPGAADGA